MKIWIFQVLSAIIRSPVHLPTKKTLKRLKGRSHCTVRSIDFHSYAYECVRPETQACAKRFAFCCIPKFKLGKLWPANLHHAIPCDQRQIDTSQHDLVSDLKEQILNCSTAGKWIKLCFVLNYIFFLKTLHRVTSYDRCSMRNDFACSKSSVTAP